MRGALTILLSEGLSSSRDAVIMTTVPRLYKVLRVVRCKTTPIMIIKGPALLHDCDEQYHHHHQLFVASIIASTQKLFTIPPMGYIVCLHTFCILQTSPTHCCLLGSLSRSSSASYTPVEAPSGWGAEAFQKFTIFLPGLGDV